ncbi:hypothetical protein C1H46_044572 [Malus baccata]|uniref:Uncharacterized protein n=1 Tax=Malus baccata TaxID=106549 RepID=A0A540K6P4_MALBA|nr:hypothetical protein C1H46_044572 [Malus baccata]
MRPHILPTFLTYAESCWLKSSRRSRNMDLLRGGRVRFFRCEIPLYYRDQGFSGNSGSKKR